MEQRSLLSRKIYNKRLVSQLSAASIDPDAVPEPVQTLLKEVNSTYQEYENEIARLTIHIANTEKNNTELLSFCENRNTDNEKMLANMMVRVRDMEQLIYIISHNLRSPIANISSLCDILRMDLGKEEHDKCLDGLELSVNKLDDVIVDVNSILDVKGGQGRSKENLLFDDMIKDINALNKTLFEKEEVKIVTDFQVAGISSIKSYLFSVFSNLISNSIRYRRREVNPEIKISSVRKGDRVILTFQDNGLGIDLEKFGNNVFGLYKRFHQHKDGRGMGLYMVKTQVELIGGSIGLKSVVNHGTEFTIELPA
jgi:signal transduction histidine kinase